MYEIISYPPKWDQMMSKSNHSMTGLTGERLCSSTHLVFLEPTGTGPKLITASRLSRPKLFEGLPFVETSKWGYLPEITPLSCLFVEYMHDKS